ncbi:MAG: glutamate formimidoyltransferase, partial [Planctomycetes bacterium]|nr:glutamate formimidoyltransferase [Planctomycetota bacterium]
LVKKIIECVPNLSEGRRPDLVDTIARRVSSLAGVSLLGSEMDPDHNRAVLTLAGEPAAVLEAALAVVAVAVEEIDIRAHTGIHPRIGAADVIPFVPFAGSTMEECVELAREAGSRIAQTHGVPVFLYERAATRPERTSLAEIRRGGLEGLAARMQSGDPAWVPDFGPREPHPTAGAVAVGAREILVAYNVELETTDERVAREIAAEVREADGGLPGVKALGFATPARGCVQVSMNLLDLSRTGVAEAFARVRELAARRGIEVRGGELVGLVPRSAVEDAFRVALAPRGFAREKILDDRIAAALSGDLHEGASPFLEALASEAPVPGGGSASAQAAALAAACAEKAARVSARKRGAAGDELRAIAERAATFRRLAVEWSRNDAAAFQKLLAAYRTKSQDRIRDALELAARVPVQIVTSLAALFTDLVFLARDAHPNIRSDVACAAGMGRGAARAAASTAGANLAELPEDGSTVRLRTKLREALGRIDAASNQIDALLDQDASER